MAKKIAFTTAFLVVGFVTSAVASVPTVTLGGYLDTEYGFISERKEFRWSDPEELEGNVRRDHALVNNAKIMISADGKLEHMMGTKYGAMIKLNADTSDGQYATDTFDDFYKAQQAMAYFEGSFGRIEVGSHTGASHALHVSATQLGKGAIGGIDAAGGIDGDWWQWINPLDEDDDAVAQEFMPVPQLYTNNIAAVGIAGVNASKITYFTPEYKGFRGGLTYIPDLESFGTVSKAMSLNKYNSQHNIYGIYRDIIEGGVHYSGKMRGLGVKAAFVGETGKAKNDYYDSSIHRLNAWEAGASVQHTNWTIAGAYGDLGKTSQEEDDETVQSRYWNVGVAYEHGPFGVSLAYTVTKSGLFESEATKIRVAALGADWRIAKGAKLYADIVQFMAKEEDEAPSNNGAVFRIGSLVHF